jgi:hypothetical protein
MAKREEIDRTDTYSKSVSVYCTEQKNKTGINTVKKFLHRVSVRNFIISKEELGSF